MNIFVLTLFTLTDGDALGMSSYGWENVCALGRSSLQDALANAESIAYTVLAAKLIYLGFTVNEHGQIFKMIPSPYYWSGEK